MAPFRRENHPWTRWRRPPGRATIESSDDAWKSRMNRDELEGKDLEALKENEAVQLLHRHSRERRPAAERRAEMLFTLAVILLIAWLLGIVGTYTIGAFVHVLLVAAIVLFIIGLFAGRRTVV